MREKGVNLTRCDRNYAEKEDDKCYMKVHIWEEAVQKLTLFCHLLLELTCLIILIFILRVSLDRKE